MISVQNLQDHRFHGWTLCHQTCRLLQRWRRPLGVNPMCVSRSVARWRAHCPRITGRRRLWKLSLHREKQISRLTQNPPLTDPKSPRPKIPLTIVNNRKKGRPFQLGAVTMESLRRRSRDPADERSCSMQPLPMRSKPVHHKMRPTGEAEGIRPW